MLKYKDIVSIKTCKMSEFGMTFQFLLVTLKSSLVSCRLVDTWMLMAPQTRKMVHQGYKRYSLYHKNISDNSNSILMKHCWIFSHFGPNSSIYLVFVIYCGSLLIMILMISNKMSFSRRNISITDNKLISGILYKSQAIIGQE